MYYLRTFILWEMRKTKKKYYFITHTYESICIFYGIRGGFRNCYYLCSKCYGFERDCNCLFNSYEQVIRHSPYICYP